jgi:hypothetical protein
MTTRPNKSVEPTAARHVAGTDCDDRTVAAVAHLWRWAAPRENFPMTYSDEKSDGCSPHLVNLATTRA